MSQDQPNLITFENVSKSYGSNTVLNDVSFDIKEGEFVYITGHSGVGKTTILKLILGEIVPNKGIVKVDKLNVSKLDEKTLPLYRQKIGVIFQDFKVLSDRTVFENVSVALAVIGLPEDKWEERVKHVLKLVGLTKHVNSFPAQLSGGELQRVSLARALVVNPKIILADEPTGNLDWETSDSLMQLLEKVNSEGKTIIMATHNMEIVKKYKKRVIHIDDNDLNVEKDEVEVEKETNKNEESADREKGGKIEKEE